MNHIILPNDPQPVTRRGFLSTSSKLAAAGAFASALPLERFALGASPGDTLKIALIGMGGRGSGAADQALSVGEGVKLVAVADVHPDRMKSSLAGLQRTHKDKVDVKVENQFLGFEAYKKAIELADVVILATPPGFRPMMFEEAVRQGKHVFMEKPVCVDAPGFRKVMAAAQVAKEKKLKVGVGLQRHHDLGYLETMKRLWDGEAGEILAMRAYWNGNTPWLHKRADLEKQHGRKLSEMEYQLRNWYYFVWLCGDHICEQHIHNLDVINWLKKGHPVKARGNGGCETRKGKDYGEIFDHHVVEFTYADGSVCFSQCRHQLGCWNDVSEHAIGSKGIVNIGSHTIKGLKGEASWRFRDDEKKAKNPYQQEHDDLFAAIRNDTPYNEAEYGATSSMTSVFGRMATYSGKEIEWDKAVASNIDTMPKNLAWDANPLVMPDADGNYQLAIPGKTVTI